MRRSRGAPLLCPIAHILLNNDNVHAVISQKKSHILPIDNISHTSSGENKYHNSLNDTPATTPLGRATTTSNKIRQIYSNLLNVEPGVRDLTPSPSRAETVGRARVRGEAVLSAGAAEDKHREGATKLSELLDGAYYHLGLCLKYYPPDAELAAIGDKYAQLHQKVAQRLSAEQIVALDMKISAHELNAHVEEAVDEAPAEPAIETHNEPTNSPQEKPKHNWVPAYVLGGMSVATLASSIVLRVVAGNKKDKLDEIRADILPDDCADSSNNDQCFDLESDSKAQRSLSTASNVTLIVSGVGAAATLGYVIYELVHKKNSKGTAQHTLHPHFGFVGNAGWMSLNGTF